MFSKIMVGKLITSATWYYCIIALISFNKEGCGQTQCKWPLSCKTQQAQEYFLHENIGITEKHNTKAATCLQNGLSFHLQEKPWMICPIFILYNHPTLGHEMWAGMREFSVQSKAKSHSFMSKNQIGHVSIGIYYEQNVMRRIRTLLKKVCL